MSNIIQIIKDLSFSRKITLFQEENVLNDIFNKVKEESEGRVSGGVWLRFQSYLNKEFIQNIDSIPKSDLYKIIENNKDNGFLHEFIYKCISNGFIDYDLFKKLGDMVSMVNYDPDGIFLFKSLKKILDTEDKDTKWLSTLLENISKFDTGDKYMTNGSFAYKTKPAILELLNKTELGNIQNIVVNKIPFLL